MPLLSRTRLTPPQPSWRPRPRAVGRFALGVVLVAVGVEAVRVMALSNRHTVIPGRVYRGAQPTPADLRELARTRGVRTVVNLRGVSPEYGWYLDEARADHDLNLSQEDVTLSAMRLPPPGEIRRLIEVFDRSEYPVYVHCKRGADRTGMASTIARLLYTDDTLAAARRQLWPINGHFRFGRTAAMDDFFDRYEAWLAQRNAAHTPALFREWAVTAYSPGPAVADLAWLDPVPESVPVNTPFAVRVRAVNRSAEAWELKPGNFAGIHLGYEVATPNMESVYRGQAGLVRKTVPPGDAVEFLVRVPPIKEPGRYALAAQMMDATGAGVPIRATSFVQFGGEAILAVVEVTRKSD